VDEREKAREGGQLMEQGKFGASDRACGLSEGHGVRESKLE
jgi:hypothetical protein